MIKETVIAVSIVTMAAGAALAPSSVSAGDEPIVVASCNPCDACNPCGGCNPCEVPATRAAGAIRAMPATRAAGAIRAMPAIRAAGAIPAPAASR